MTFLRVLRALRGPIGFALTTEVTEVTEGLVLRPQRERLEWRTRRASQCRLAITIAFARRWPGMAALSVRRKGMAQASKDLRNQKTRWQKMDGKK